MVMMISGDLNIYTGNELYIMYVLYTIIGIKWLVDMLCKYVSDIMWISIPVCLLHLRMFFVVHKLLFQTL